MQVGIYRPTANAESAVALGGFECRRPCVFRLGLPTYSSSRLRRARRRCMYRTPTTSEATTRPIVVVSITVSLSV
jgi:hypothetical protein